jgi:hypothetical protein
MSTLAVIYECDRRLSSDRQRAIEEAFSALKLAATVATDTRQRFLARECATECRRLITAFGVRRARRFEYDRTTLRATCDAAISRARAARSLRAGTADATGVPA